MTVAFSLPAEAVEDDLDSIREVLVYIGDAAMDIATDKVRRRIKSPPGASK